MKDHLEDFIKNNREDFDFREPKETLWSAIEKELPEQKKGGGKVKRMIWRSMSIAAGLVLLVGLIGTWAYNYGVQQGEINSLADISTELGEVERHYKGEIKEKLGQLVAIHKDAGVTEDLKEMESFLNELKQDLAETPVHEREVVIQAIIENYRSRVELLERVLDRLPNHSSQQKNSNDETKSI